MVSKERITRDLRGGDLEAMDKLCQDMCQELKDQHAQNDAQASLTALQNLLEYLQSETQEASDLVDLISLDICAPVLLCGELSEEHGVEVGRLLGVLANKGTAREVFTGLTEAVSLVPLDYWQTSHEVFFLILSCLPTLLSRIKRKQASYIIASFKFVLQLIQKHKGANLNMDEDDQEDWVMVIQKDLDAYKGFAKGVLALCFEMGDMCALEDDISRVMKPFLVLVLESTLSEVCQGLAIEEERVGECPSDVGVVLGSMAQFASELSVNLNDLGNVNDLVVGWKAACEDDACDDEWNEMMSRNFEIGLGFLLWSCFRSEILKDALQVTVEPQVTKLAFKAMLAMSSVGPSIGNVPVIYAMLDLLKKILEGVQLKCIGEPPLDYDGLNAFVGKDAIFGILTNLTKHMNSMPSMEMRMSCLAAIEHVLPFFSDSVKWDALEVLIMCPFPDISAIMFQKFKSVVIECINNTDSTSKFSSACVFEIIRKLSQPNSGPCCQDWQSVVQHAELLAAVLNLARFLVIKECKMGTNRTGILDRGALMFLQDECIGFLNACISTAKEELDENEHLEDVMGMSRLHVVVMSLEEAITNA